MIHTITRHAAQSIWHQAIHCEGEGNQGLLVSDQEKVIAGSFTNNNIPQSEILSQIQLHGSQRICGLFYMDKPDENRAIAQENMLNSLIEGDSPLPWLHIHLDLESDGLLKMKAYTLHNHALAPISLIMETN